MDTATQKYLELVGRRFVLVGTAHVSEQSVEEVSRAVESVKPDCVAIELDEKRLASLENPDSWRNMDIVKVLREKSGFLMLANIILASYEKKLGLSAGVKPGDEMLAAIRKAREMGISTEMVDRPVSVTFRRAWAENSLSGKCNLLAALLASAFSKEEVSTEQIENLKNKSEMDELMSEVAQELPDVKRVLIDERDFYLASHIWQCKGDTVLAVLGAGHLPGVQAHLEKLASGEENPDCSEIERVPEKSTGAKAAGWIIPALIVALIVSGFVFGGIKKGWDMLSAWVLWNGALAAVGALVAGGHPLTVLVSFVGAPFTSLCPFIGIGVVSGIVQAVICKPKVEDMENLSSEPLSVKSFYKNRILRTLQVFFLSSIGSSVGTFVAGASFVTIFGTIWQKISSVLGK